MTEIAEKKQALNVTGKSPAERAKEFEALNHLLQYKISDIVQGSCIIPGFEKAPYKKAKPKAQPKPTTDDSELELELELEAEALILELELMEMDV